MIITKPAKNMTVYMSSDAAKEAEKITELAFRQSEFCAEYDPTRCLDSLDEQVQALIDAFSRKSKKDNLAIVEAHGFSNSRKWVYSDKSKLNSLQNLVSRIEKKHHAVILRVCNNGGANLFSRSTILIYPSTVYKSDLLGGQSEHELGMNIMDVYVPGHGKIDSYTIDSVIDAIENSASSRRRVSA